MGHTSDIDCYLFLQSRVNREQIVDLVQTMQRQYQWLEYPTRFNDYIDHTFDREKYKYQSGLSISYSEYFSIYLTNKENDSVWNSATQDDEPPGLDTVYKHGLSQFTFQIATWRFGGAIPFIEEFPQFGKQLLPIFGLVAQKMDAVIAFEVYSNYTDFDDHLDEMQGIERYKRLLRASGPTYYVNDELMNELGPNEIRKWATIVEPVPNGGYVISVDEIPFIDCSGWWEGTRDLQLYRKFKDRLLEAINDNFEKLGVDPI